MDVHVPEGIDPVADPLAAIEHYIEHHLPTCFHGVGYVYQLSGSMGHPSKPGQLRCHLYYLMAKPLLCVEAEAWARQWVPECDHTAHRIVQVNYTSDPVLMGQQVDPLAGRRTGMVQGYLQDELELPPTMPVPDLSRLRSLGAAGRRALLDPRGTAGVIGALCRAYRPDQLPELVPDLFTASANDPRRITWHAGGGTPEGVRVTDDGLHLFNSHHIAPVQHACHLFDFIRAHVYGDLDVDLDPDALAMAPALAPSYKATEAWARGLPAVATELVGPGAAVAEVARIEAREDKAAEGQLSEADERAARMDRVLALVDKADMDGLELKLAREASCIDWTDGERARLVKAMQDRTKVLLGGRGLPLDQIRAWLAPRGADGEALFARRGVAGQPLATLESLAAVFAARGWTARYNVIAKKQEVLGVEVSADDSRANATFARVQSECAKMGLSISRPALKAYLLCVCGSNPYNPVATWIDSAPWDGTPRVELLLGTLTLAESADTELALTVLRKWLIQCVAMALSAKPLQAQGVLTLLGPQNIGKSRWTQRLCWGGPPKLVLTGRLIKPRDKDSVKTCISCWICEISELGATVRKADRYALKAFITQDVDAIRLPYAAEDSEFQRRTCFVASVNDEEFLNDETGNSRFWIMPVTACDADHDIDMQQVWAEMAAAWRGGEAHYLEQQDMRRVNTAIERHQVGNPIQEAISSCFAWPELPAGQHTYNTSHTSDWTSMSCTAILKVCGYRTPSKADTTSAGRALRRLGARQSSKWREWMVPARRAGFAEEG
ncbi:VapE domain-containing protein [Rubrivivax sp. A210]|uniref:VapE domain-containing protein n=1 Tax=Rubrivivax sp. A210 TaxID=2772301 RepID=UPI00191A8788|nr:VapE domain-containing protein [Rubrivivax sp. A210]